MAKIYSAQDRQEAFEYVLSAARECERIIALVQVGSGATGYRDDRSDLDFVIALDSDGSMPEAMDFIHRKIAEQYDLLVFQAGRTQASPILCTVRSPGNRYRIRRI